MSGPIPRLPATAGWTKNLGRMLERLLSPEALALRARYLERAPIAPLTLPGGSGAIVSGARPDPSGVAAQRAASAWEMLARAEPLRVDRRQPVLFGGPIVPDAIGQRSAMGQTPNPRVPPRTSRAALGQMAGLTNPENMALNLAMSDRGAEIGNVFYPSYANYERTMMDAGADPREVLWSTTGGSIQTPVRDELVHGSLMRWALHNGLLDPNVVAGASKDDLMKLSAKLREVYRQTAPAGASGLSTFSKGHPQAFARRMVNWPVDAYKIPTYGAQKGSIVNPNRGNVRGAVLDTHMARDLGVAAPFGSRFAAQSGFSQYEYPVAEQAISAVGEETGLTDRAAQASVWAGGGPFSGLMTPPDQPYDLIADDLFRWNAKAQGLSLDKLLREVAMGRRFLYRPPPSAVAPVTGDRR